MAGEGRTMGDKRKQDRKRVGGVQRLRQGEGCTEFDSDVITEIVKYRIEHHLNQKEMAERLAVTAPQLSKWENFHTRPSPLREEYFWEFLYSSTAQ